MMILSLVRNYIPSYEWVVKRRLEHRRLRRALLRPGRHERRHGRRRAHRSRRAAPTEAVRRQAALHRPAPPAGGGREGARPHLSTRTSSRMVKVCDVVTINAPLHPETEHMFNDKLIAKMKRGAYLVNTARGKICDRDADRAGAGERPTRRLRGRRLVPAAGAQGSSVADHAASRHDAAHLWLVAVGAGALRGRHARDPRVLVRQEADPQRVPDRRQGQAGRRRRAFLQRRRCDQGLGGRGALQEERVIETGCRITAAVRHPPPTRRGTG